MDLEDDFLEGQIENASAIAECALENAYANRDCSDLDSELERAFKEFRAAAETIKSRVIGLNMMEKMRGRR